LNQSSQFLFLRKENFEALFGMLFEVVWGSCSSISPLISVARKLGLFAGFCEVEIDNEVNFNDNVNF
jgi:hypothetical protein